jgi:hypothetical protein
MKIKNIYIQGLIKKHHKDRWVLALFRVRGAFNIKIHYMQVNLTFLLVFIGKINKGRIGERY